jgi:hypothetical protein
MFMHSPMRASDCVSAEGLGLGEGLGVGLGTGAGVGDPPALPPPPQEASVTAADTAIATSRLR